ncbi:Hypothetical protein CINCED_3A003328 [Cinara cedri]|uniref:Uncharacterized protein n=1 Tax=Cinara cedri TaxID=506608 RepID=A0A5E4ND45_9HEMI|nr:Hypothetical protein CINCED_3A003328 [Cinara cedri]
MAKSICITPCDNNIKFAFTNATEGAIFQDPKFQDNFQGMIQNCMKARACHEVCRVIQNSKESIAKLAEHYNLNPKAIVKWKKRSFVIDAAIGPKHGKSKMSTQGEEAIIVTFRKHILLPLDNCLYSLRAIIPCLTRSSLHHCLQRHGISILSDVEGEIKAKKKFKLCPIGYFHIDIAEVITEEGQLQLNLLMLNCIITL